VFVFSFLVLSFLLSFFVGGGQEVNLSKGLCWFIPGVAVGILHAAYLLSVGLLDVSQADLDWRLVTWAPSCFLGV
jgi:hypothetical protein